MDRRTLEGVGTRVEPSEEEVIPEIKVGWLEDTEEVRSASLGGTNLVTPIKVERVNQQVRRLPRLPDIADEPTLLESPRGRIGKFPEFNLKETGEYFDTSLSQTILRRSPKLRKLYAGDMLSGPFKTSTPTKLSQPNQPSDTTSSGKNKGGDLDLSLEYSETEFQESTQEDLLKRLRCWRQEAFENHLYETAIFWGTKVLMFRTDKLEAYELAEIYYSAGQYQQSLKTIMNYGLSASSVRCRILEARCYLALGNFILAADTIGQENKIRGQPLQEDIDDEAIRLQSIDCFLRGKIYFELGCRDIAKRSFLEALQIDIRCYDALHCLINHDLLTSDEEDSILRNFNRLSIGGERQRKRKFEEETSISLDIVELHDMSSMEVDLETSGPSKRTNLNHSGTTSNPNCNLSTKAPKTNPINHGDTQNNTPKYPPISSDQSIGNKKSYKPKERTPLRNVVDSPQLDQDINYNEHQNNNQPPIGNLAPAISDNHIKFITSTYNLKFQRKRIENAELVLSKVFSLAEDWDALLWKAQDDYFQSQLHQSYQKFKLYMQRSPANTECLPHFITVLFELKLTDELARLAQEVEDFYGHHYLSLYSLGLLRSLQGHREVARSLLRSCCENYPTFVPAWLSYGHLCSDHDTAIKAYATASRLSPSSFESFYHLGRRYREVANYPLAESYLKQADKLSKYLNPYLANELGLIDYAKEEYQSALEHFHHGLMELRDHDPAEHENIQGCLWSNLGHCCRKMDNLLGARMCFTNALALNPRSSIANAGLAMVTHVLGQPYEYIDLYQRALGDHPDHPVLKALLTESFCDNLDVPPPHTWVGSDSHPHPHSPTVNHRSLLDAILPPPRRKYPPVPVSATQALGLNTSEALPTMNILPDDEEILELTIP